MSARCAALAVLCGSLLLPRPAAADDAAAPASDGLEHLVPSLAEDPFHVSGGERQFLRRLSFSPAFGYLGGDRLYAMRLAYNPNPWLGWEASIGHNPATSVHALLHTLDLVLRKPLPWRVQPFVRAGYGMMLVYPGLSLNADPVTANLLGAGGGVEFYVRNDVALRVDGRALTAIGGHADGEKAVAYHYDEFTIGLSFYRGLGE